MSEKQNIRTSEQLTEEDKFKISRVQRANKAIQDAMDGYAPTAELWTQAVNSFRLESTGATSVEDALRNALVGANKGDRAETPPSRAELKFWDQMGDTPEGKEPEVAIVRALDGYAPDTETWKEGYTAFYKALDDGTTVEVALETALKAAESPFKESTDAKAKSRFYASYYDPREDPEFYNGALRGTRIPIGDDHITIGIGGLETGDFSESHPRTRKARKLAAKVLEGSKDRER